MVFSSVSSFLDPPNWPQQTNHQQQASGSVIATAHEGLSHHHQLPPLPPNPNPSHHHGGAGAGGGPARLGGSMAERARLAKIPQPEGALKCPRCDSTNTKFCYFNNYSLSQPRHFCKACRRYWTRGGALRNVPVGGGCRRNKKGKNGNSKSSSSSSNNQNKQTITGSSSSAANELQQPQMNSQFPFLPSLHNLAQLGGIGLNLSAINSNNQAQIGSSSLMNDLGFVHVGTGASTSALISNNNNENVLTSVGTTSQFAFFDPTTGLYCFQNEGNIGNNIGISRVSPMAPVKTEENHLLNLSRPVAGLTPQANSNNPYWPVGSDLLGSSNNTNHIL